ncbi:MAG: hypothetical protein M1836_001490 [Candelina mexicana]|nr:MAG: hypothetical protein M1836_001490 [Candelina mexicana]
MFHGMTALDLGVAWTFKRDANSHQDWISGCGGQVFGTPVSGGGPGFKLIRSNQAALALNEVPIRGANFLRFSGSQPQMAAAQGIRAFLAGGGTMFTDGRANPSFGDTSIAASGGASLLNSGDGAASEAEPSADMDVKDLEDVQKASALADRMAGTNSVYPTIVGIDGTNYTQQGGRMSLLYKDEKTNFMIDLATRTPTACLDAWDCEIEQACSHQILRDQLLLYGAQLALGTIGICQSLNS